MRRLAEQEKSQKGLGDLKVARDAYLDLIDGIVFGPDPRQGYVADGRFFHPELRFEFPLPEGWNLENMAAQVQMMSENEKAMMLMSLGTEGSPAEEADAFVSSSGAEVLANTAVTVNRLSARRLLTQATSDGTTLRILSYFISNGGRIYVMHGFSASSDFGGFRETFESTMRGFRNLDDADRINVEPVRLRIHRVEAPATLEEVLNQIGVEEDQFETLAHLNGMQLSDPLETGMRIKVPGPSTDP